MDVWRTHQQKIQPDGQIKAPPTVPHNSVAAARMSEQLGRLPTPVSSYRDIEPIDTSWQNPLPFHMPSAALHSVAAFESGIDNDEDESKVSADWLSLHSLVSVNHPQSLSAATARAAAMPHQQAYLQHGGFESLTAMFRPPMAAAEAYPEQQHQQHQQPHPEQRDGLESLAQNLDDDSMDLFLSMFRRSG